MSGKYRFEDNDGNFGIIGPGVDAQFWYGDVFAVTREEAYSAASKLLAALDVEAMKRIASAPVAQGLTAASISMSRHSRAMLLNVLWHHQGGSSPVGQPIRVLLGIGQHDRLNDEHLAEAKWIDGLLAAPSASAQQAELTDAAAVADALEAEYLAVANGEKKPAKMALEPLARAVQTIRAFSAAPAPTASTADAAALCEAKADKIDNGKSKRVPQVDRHVADVLRRTAEEIRALPSASPAASNHKQRGEEMKRYSHFGDMTDNADGEWIRYSDHVEAMKRIAGDSAQQAEPVAYRVASATSAAAAHAGE